VTAFDASSAFSPVHFVLVSRKMSIFRVFQGKVRRNFSFLDNFRLAAARSEVSCTVTFKEKPSPLNAMPGQRNRGYNVGSPSIAASDV
jgi:hypothetical protein